jgi:Uma2 family endonuclease
MNLSAPQTFWTADLARALPNDGKRYEVLDGELFVSPAPSFNHQRVVQSLFRLLDHWVKLHALGEAFIAPAEVEFSPSRLLQPDLFVIPPTPGQRPRSFSDVGKLLLAVEVQSPNTARADRTKKRVIFQDEGVPEYWIVDPHGRVIERWATDDKRPEIISTSIRWQPTLRVLPVEIDLQRFFADALD